MLSPEASSFLSLYFLVWTELLLCLQEEQLCLDSVYLPILKPMLRLQLSPV